MLDGEWRRDKFTGQWKLGPGISDPDGTSWKQPATGLANEAIVVGPKGDWHTCWDMPQAKEFGPEAQVAHDRLEQASRLHGAST